jgi:dTDP-L-rhamnose 4-epimerase
MTEKVLITGGAGFVGSHLADKLLEKGYAVSVFDNLEPQVHGGGKRPPAYLNKEVEFINGDVRDRERLKKALKGADIVSHQAAMVGVGQSMYKIQYYIEVNASGTANLLDLLVNEKNSVRKLVVASSMSLYGEGLYSCRGCGEVHPQLRPKEQLQAKDWEMRCPNCSQTLGSLPTNENKPLNPTSVYAISKRIQEELCLNVGLSYQIPVVALRYFNIYGPRQSLSNPYTGVMAIFSSCFLNNHVAPIFEDGRQTRDFIHVKDIVQANVLSIEKKEADYQVFNVGTGRAVSVLEIAQMLSKKLKKYGDINITKKFRTGDIRHCFADISRITRVLGFKPSIRLEEGIEDLTNWVAQQTSVDRINEATIELEEKGLIL